MREADFAFFIESNALEVVDESGIISNRTRSQVYSDLLDIIHPRLQDHGLRSQVGQEAVMHQRSEPDRDPVRTAEFLLANQQVDAPVIVVHAIDQPAQSVFFHPVDLKVPKRPPVPASDDREAVPARQVLQEELLLHGLVTADSPHGFHSRIVHPPMQRLEIGRHVLRQVLLDAGHSRTDWSRRRRGPTSSTGPRHSRLGHRQEWHAEGQILAQARDIPHVKDLSLVRWLGPDGMAHSIGKGILRRRRRVVRR